jgi:hypothetical protein
MIFPGNLHLNRCRASEYLRSYGRYGHTGESRPIHRATAARSGGGHRSWEQFEEVVW